MKRITLLVGIVPFLLMTVSCSTSVGTEEEIQNKATSKEDRSTSGIQDTGTVAGPNLEIYAYTYDEWNEDLGNGMQRIWVAIGIKNASSEWWSYSIKNSMVGNECIWGAGTSLGDAEGMGSPVLTTQEGYTYSAITSINLECGPRVTSDLPPGVSLIYIGATDDESFGNPFAGIPFEIPVNSTPGKITIPYSSGNRGLSDIFDPRSVISDIQINPSDGIDTAVIDPEYLDYVDMYRVSEKIQIGDFAEIIVQSSRRGESGNIPITITITSLHEGYPLKINYYNSTSSLLLEHYRMCCHKSLTSWQGSDNYQIGPLQTLKLSSDFEIASDQRIWLVLTIELTEVGGNKRGESSHFVVELTE